MNHNKNYLSALRCIALVLILKCTIISAYGSELFHTIQVGSFTAVAKAQKKYASIEKKLSEEECDHLRIEKIGKFYTVRLGKFDDFKVAEKFLQTVKPSVRNATLMKAYIKDERIVKLYSDSSSTKKQKVEPDVSTEPKPDPKPKPDKIKSDITKKVDQNRGDTTLHEGLGNIASLVDKKEFEAAFKILEAKIAQDPESPQLNAWFGMVLLKMDKPTKALKYFANATELSPEESDYHNGFGYCLFNLNMFDNAIEEFNKAISLDPGHVDSLTGLGISYVKSGKKAEAMKVYNKLVRLDEKTSDKLLKLIEKTM